MADTQDGAAAPAAAEPAAAGAAQTAAGAAAPGQGSAAAGPGEAHAAQGASAGPLVKKKSLRPALRPMVPSRSPLPAICHRFFPRRNLYRTDYAGTVRTVTMPYPPPVAQIPITQPAPAAATGLKALPAVSPAGSASATPRVPAERAAPAAPAGAAGAGAVRAQPAPVVLVAQAAAAARAPEGQQAGASAGAAGPQQPVSVQDTDASELVSDSLGAGSTSAAAADRALAGQIGWEQSGQQSEAQSDAGTGAAHGTGAEAAPAHVHLTPEDEIAKLRAQLADKDALLMRLQALESAVGIGGSVQPGVTGAAGTDATVGAVNSAQPGAAPETTGETKATTFDRQSSVMRRLPSTIPEMEVVEGTDQLISNFAKRAKRPVSAKGGKSKERLARDKDPSLSEEVRGFMATWRQAREKEIKTLIVDTLRRSYLTLARDDEECKELTMAINSLHDARGASRGVCEYLRQRLRGSFLLRPEEVVLCRPRGAGSDTAGSIQSASSIRSAGAHLESPARSMDESAFDDHDSMAHELAIRQSIPGTVVAAPSQASPRGTKAAWPPTLKQSLSHLNTSAEENKEETARESLEERLLTKQRFRHELARALRTHDENPCVEVLVQCEEPVRLAYAYKPAQHDQVDTDVVRDPEKDLYDVGRFCDKYGNLDAWARATANAEWHGVASTITFMQGTSRKAHTHEPCLIVGAPRKQNIGQYVIETREDFLSGLPTEDDASLVMAAHARTLCFLVAAVACR